MNDKQFCQLVNSIDELLPQVYANFVDNYQKPDYLCKRAILASLNATVARINSTILEWIPAEAMTFKSIDSVMDRNQAALYPVELLNCIHPPGFPAHMLDLKVGAIIMLIRNLDPPKLCNGTRLCITKLHRHLIEATILSECAKGEPVFMPRIPLISTGLPFQFRRLQFPVMLSFAMSINKAQGQTMDMVGVDLEEPCFGHGQLYVACSRVGAADKLFIHAPGGKTPNIVFKEVIKSILF